MGQGCSKSSYFHDISQVQFTDKQRQAIEKQTQTEPVMVYSKQYCPHCSAAKELLKKNGVKGVKVREINKEEDGLETQAILYHITKQRTVPNIFIAGKHIGGNSELQRLARSGELKKMLDLHQIPHNIQKKSNQSRSNWTTDVGGAAIVL